MPSHPFRDEAGGKDGATVLLIHSKRRALPHPSPERRRVGCSRLHSCSATPRAHDQAPLRSVGDKPRASALGTRASFPEKQSRRRTRGTCQPPPPFKSSATPSFHSQYVFGELCVLFLPPRYTEINATQGRTEVTHAHRRVAGHNLPYCGRSHHMVDNFAHKTVQKSAKLRVTSKF
jgi:hypothetical protein